MNFKKRFIANRRHHGMMMPFLRLFLASFAGGGLGFTMMGLDYCRRAGVSRRERDGRPQSRCLILRSARSRQRRI